MFYLPLPFVGWSIAASYDPLIVHIMVEGFLGTNQPFGAQKNMNVKESTVGGAKCLYISAKTYQQGTGKPQAQS